MKIVGLISNEDELDEMENIAKIFLIEKRMREVSKESTRPKVFRKKTYQLPPKIQIYRDQIQHPRFTVRGLN
ncbi:MAG: hypothetical protein V1726_01180 [Methanobacteriota archaeon]